MRHSVRRMAAFTIALTSLLVMASSSGTLAGKDKKSGKSAGPDSVIVLIGNRMFPDFGEIISTRLHERQPVGDTEFSFEVVSFYPHFSIIDSTKSIVSLSDEPKNPAFRIKVFKDAAVVDSTWAFYAMDVPHFSRSSALWFRVLQFDYRGTVFKKAEPKPSDQDSGKKKK